MRFCPNNANSVIFNKHKHTNLVSINPIFHDPINDNDNLIYANLRVNDHDTIALIDTGSESSIIDLNLATTLSYALENYTGPVLRAANESEIIVVGKTKLEITIPGSIMCILVWAQVFKNIKHIT